MGAYLTLFGTSFLSATVLPGASEIALAALLYKGYDPWVLWGIATFANSAGSVVNWVLGRYLLHHQDKRWFPIQPDRLATAERWFERRGVWALTLAWVPVVGDGLTFVAGLLRTPLLVFLGLVAVGKAARYAVVVLLLPWG